LIHRRALVYLRQNEFDKARADASAMKAIAPDHNLPFEILGKVCEALTERAHAIKCYEKAIQLIEKRSSGTHNARRQEHVKVRNLVLFHS
jgi:Tfp pilus assembly protein PilF